MHLYTCSLGSQKQPEPEPVPEPEPEEEGLQAAPTGSSSAKLRRQLKVERANSISQLQRQQEQALQHELARQP